MLLHLNVSDRQVYQMVILITIRRASRAAPFLAPQER